MKKISPRAVAVLALLIGLGLLVSGVFVLAGLGWALLAGAMPFFGFAGLIFRGLLRG